MARSLESLFGKHEDGDKTFLLALILFGLYFLLRRRRQPQAPPAELPAPQPPEGPSPEAAAYAGEPFYGAPEPPARPGSYIPPGYR